MDELTVLAEDLPQDVIGDARVQSADEDLHVTVNNMERTKLNSPEAGRHMTCAYNIFSAEESRPDDFSHI